MKYLSIGAALAFLVVVIGILVVASTTDAAAKCRSIQARCAVEIGGTCDPITGHWEYGGGDNGRGSSGGTNRGGAFDACVSRNLQNRKQK